MLRPVASKYFQLLRADGREAQGTQVKASSDRVESSAQRIRISITYRCNLQVGFTRRNKSDQIGWQLNIMVRCVANGTEQYP